MERKVEVKTPTNKLRPSKEDDAQTGQEWQQGAVGACCWPGRGRRALWWSHGCWSRCGAKLPISSLSRHVSLTCTKTVLGIKATGGNRGSSEPYYCSLMMRTVGHRAATSPQPEGWHPPLRLGLPWRRTKQEPAHREMNSFSVLWLPRMSSQNSKQPKVKHSMTENLFTYI